jgi:redox-sensitive bicupin YhaK (pirin superfamily)
MEIITIPLNGEIQHEDSMGHKEIIRANQVQVMSAGSGIYHSEFNSSKTEELKLFQIWIFPDKENLEPRYATINYSWENAKNNFLPLVSPKKENKGAWIHQNAWIHIIKIEKAQTATYTIKNKDNGVYIMLIDGFIEIENKKMKDRDAIGIWETDSVNIFSEVDSQLLLIEVPMKF